MTSNDRYNAARAIVVAELGERPAQPAMRTHGGYCLTRQMAHDNMAEAFAIQDAQRRFDRRVKAVLGEMKL